jgi:hypothetical protein
MRKLPAILFAATIVAVGCTNEPEQPFTVRSSSIGTATSKEDVAAEIEIYSAVIRRLVTKDHTFGGGPLPFNHVYVVNGAISDAGDPLGNHFGPPKEPFPSELVHDIEQRLQDLPPVRFVSDANDLRRGQEGAGGVKNNGVIITLSPIQQKDGKVHVSNGLWCGGTCGQWLTYVLVEDGARWKITGTTGPYGIS